jgi:pimeloyl-ACP methyl ester carboxylesterase
LQPLLRIGRRDISLYIVIPKGNIMVATSRVLFVFCCLVMLIVGTSVQAQSPAYRDTPCPFDTSPLLMEVRCGILQVPENRLDSGSRMITLAVMTALSPNSEKSPDPIVYLTGGPGESAIAAMMPIFSSEAGLTLVEDRDWVVIDQRGTGYSVPRLDCNIFGIARIVTPSALQEASQVCYQRYAGAEIDLAGYTTDQNAADLADLRVAMGYESWNLFGVSYGTTLALTIMDKYPEGIRAAVLDSTLPPSYSFFVSDVEMKVRALETLFAACRLSAACDAAYPELAARFEAAVVALNESPIEIDGLPITGDFLLFALTNTSVFQRQVIEQLPTILGGALEGDFAGIAALLGGVASGSDAEGGYETDAVAANDGMGLAMNCSRDARLPGVRDRLVAIADEDAVAASLASLYLRYLDACDPWLDGLAPLTPPAAVNSDIPTLFLAGEWDPSTPPALAFEAAESLTNAEVIVFPGQGHSVLLDAESDCPAALVNTFMRAPYEPLDTTCVDADYPSINFGG